MATVTDILKELPNFYELFDREDQEALKGLVLGYVLRVNDLLGVLYQYDRAKSIRTITPSIRRIWFHLDLRGSNATSTPGQYAIEPEIVRVPFLQNGITDKKTDLIELEDGVDYTLEETSGLVTFLTPAARALVDKVIPLFTTLAEPNAAWTYIDSGAATADGLVNGTDYLFTPGETEATLLTKEAIDAFLALNVDSVIKAIESTILWAPEIFIDDKLVEENFGVPMGFSKDDVGFDLETYTRIVKGLWLIHFSGVSLKNIRNGLSLIFNYPTAPVKGRITKIVFKTAPVFLVGSVPDGVQGISYEPYQIPVGGELPITVTVEVGPLPPGLALTPEGFLLGEPTFAGDYPVTIRATNAHGFTDQLFTIKVSGAPIFLDATTLPAQTQDVAFDFFFTIDSIAGLSVSLIAGTLPLGVTFDSGDIKLTGTPLESGTFLFTLEATNPVGSSQKEFSITVNAVPPNDGTITTDQGPSLPDASAD